MPYSIEVPAGVYAKTDGLSIRVLPNDDGGGCVRLKCLEVPYTMYPVAPPNNRHSRFRNRYTLTWRLYGRRIMEYRVLADGSSCLFDVLVELEADGYSEIARFVKKEPFPLTPLLNRYLKKWYCCAKLGTSCFQLT
jgi:hypothetical protein